MRKSTVLNILNLVNFLASGHHFEAKGQTLSPQRQHIYAANAIRRMRSGKTS